MSTSRRPLQIDFCDFWPGFNKTNNYFYLMLNRRFDVRLTDQPDFIFYANPLMHVHRLYSCVKIYFGIEAYQPDWSECDYALTCHYLEDPRHLRLPYYVLCGPATQLDKQAEDLEQLVESRKHFCSFVVSNSGKRKTQKRVDFFHRLSQYKQVDSGGRAFNNIGGPLPEGWQHKLEFLRSRKFHIAFENESLPGYTTEKLFQAMLARTVPIYWGSPRIHEEFNPRSFLNYFDFPSEEALIERIIELDRDDQKYLEVLRQPYVRSDLPNPCFDPNRFLDFFERILDAKTPPISRRKSFFKLGRWTLVKRNK